MVTTYNWVAVAELVSKTTGKFLVGANYDSFFPANNSCDMVTWDNFAGFVREFYENETDESEIIYAIIFDELICFETEQEAKSFYASCFKRLTINALRKNKDAQIPFIFLVSPTEGYLTDTN